MDFTIEIVSRNLATTSNSETIEIAIFRGVGYRMTHGMVKEMPHGTPRE